MDHLAQATTDHNMQYVIKSTRRAGSTHGNYTATAKLKPPLNGHLDLSVRPMASRPGLEDHNGPETGSGAQH
jgi:hypothetical protein